jgi:hypothetical protein
MSGTAMPEAREQACHVAVPPPRRGDWCILMNTVFIFSRIGNNNGPLVSKTFDFKLSIPLATFFLLMVRHAKQAETRPQGAPPISPAA